MRKEKYVFFGEETNAENAQKQANCGLTLSIWWIRLDPDAWNTPLLVTESC